MTLTFHWFLPTNGDSRDVVGGGHGVPTGSAGGERPPSVAYLGQVAILPELQNQGHADVYLTWGEPPEAVAKKVEWIRALAAREGREIRFGIRLHTISRDTAGEAWAEAARLLDRIDDQTIASIQAGLERSESEGQRRMLALNNGTRDNLEVAPNLWAGVGLVRGGAGTALVGSHTEVADRIEEYHRIGIDEFVLSGYPHLEAAYWFAEGVLPVLASRGLWQKPGGLSASTSSLVPFAAPVGAPS